MRKDKICFFISTILVASMTLTGCNINPVSGQIPDDSVTSTVDGGQGSDTENNGTENNNGNSEEDNMNEGLPEITDEDWETIKYVNENSHIYIEFMKPIYGVEPNTNPDHESNYYESSTGGLVTGVGHYIPDLDGMYLSKVEINNNDRTSDILGVKNNDKYLDAIDKLEKEGFSFYKEKPISKDRSKVICKKGNIAVTFWYAPNKKKDVSTYTISSLTVTLYRESNSNEEPDGIP